MDVYKYKVVKTKTDIGEVKLNEFGRRGYELAGIVSDQFGFTYYFKIKVENNG